MFQRRHYEAIAKLIRNLEVDPHTRAVLVLKFAALFAGDSERFKLTPFKEACNVNEQAWKAL